MGDYWLIPHKQPKNVNNYKIKQKSIATKLYLYICSSNNTGSTKRTKFSGFEGLSHRPLRSSFLQLWGDLVEAWSNPERSLSEHLCSSINKGLASVGAILAMRGELAGGGFRWRALTQIVELSDPHPHKIRSIHRALVPRDGNGEIHIHASRNSKKSTDGNPKNQIWGRFKDENSQSGRLFNQSAGPCKLRPHSCSGLQLLESFLITSDSIFKMNKRTIGLHTVCRRDIIKRKFFTTQARAELLCKTKAKANKTLNIYPQLLYVGTNSEINLQYQLCINFESQLYWQYQLCINFGIHSHAKAIYYTTTYAYTVYQLCHTKICQKQEKANYNTTTCPYIRFHLHPSFPYNANATNYENVLALVSTCLLHFSGINKLCKSPLHRLTKAKLKNTSIIQDLCNSNRIKNKINNQIHHQCYYLGTNIVNHGIYCSPCKFRRTPPNQVHPSCYKILIKISYYVAFYYQIPIENKIHVSGESQTQLARANATSDSQITYQQANCYFLKNRSHKSSLQIKRTSKHKVTLTKD